MTTSEILELVRAGYTKAEIESLSGAEIQKNKQEEKQEVKQEEKQEKKQEKKQEVKQEVKEENNGYKELLEVVNSLKDTVKVMQADNAKKASNEQPKTETAESAIKSFFEDTPKN